MVTCVKWIPLSGYYLAGHLERTYDGMMIAIPEHEWSLFQEMSTKRFIRILQELALPCTHKYHWT